MKKIYPLLLIIFTLMLFLKHDDAFSQNKRALSKQQQQPDKTATIDPQRIVSPAPEKGRDAADGSIWVNRNEIINGRDVTLFTPEELLRDILLGHNNNQCGVDGMISNVKFTGYGWDQGNKTWTNTEDKRSLSYFSHGTVDQDVIIDGFTIRQSLDMESGLLLSTSSGRDAEGPNEFPNGMGTPTNVMLTNDPDLNTLANDISNGARLEFDFIPLQSEISFDYIFASEEYPEYVNSAYNDVFGFWISELDRFGNIIPGTTQNIALLPTTQTSSYVVSINNVNNGYAGTNSPEYFPGSNPKNPQYYVANYQPNPYKGLYSEFDGRTIVLTAKADVVPGKNYRLKLAVANVGSMGFGNYDQSYGSGVFLRAGSLDLGTGLLNFLGEGGLAMNNIFELCESNVLEISFPPSPTETTSIDLDYSGPCANNVCQLDNSPMPASVTAPLDATSISIPYKVLSPVSVNGGEIKIRVTTNRGNCEKVDSIYLTVYSAIRETDPEIITTSACNSDGGSIKVTIPSNIGSPNARMSIDGGINWKRVGEKFTGLPAGDYVLMVSDSISCDTLPFPVTIYGQPILNSGSTIPDICNGETVDYTATCPFAGTTFSWTRAPIPGISPSTGSGTGPIINETLTNTTANRITVTYVYTLLNGDCSNTQEVTVFVYPVFSQSDPAGASIPYNTSHTINLGAPVGSSGVITYLWEDSFDGITWSPAPPQNNRQDYTTPALTCNMYYRRQATGPVCGNTITSEAALIIVSCSVSLSSDPPGIFELDGDGDFPWDEEITVTVKPEECWEFVNWTEDGIPVHNQLSYTFHVSKNHNLVANFIKEQYNVSVSEDLTGGGTADGSGNFECGDEVIVTATTEDCWAFVNWTDEKNDEISKENPYVFILKENVELIANFEKEYYDVNISAYPEPCGIVTGGGDKIECGSTLTITAEPTDCSMFFINWTDENGNEVTDQLSFIIDYLSEEHTFIAHFEQKTFDIILSVDPAIGNNGFSGGGPDMPCGEYITIIAESDDCYDFINWTEDGDEVSGTPDYTFLVEESRVLVANFEIQLHDIFVSVNTTAGGTVFGNDSDIECGTNVTVEAFADDCYNFMNWTDEDTGEEYEDNPLTFPLIKTTTLIANFEIKTFDIDLTPSPSMGGDVSGYGNFDCGTFQTITADPDECYNFIQWEENGIPVTDINPYNFKLTEYRDLVAIFQIKTFNLEVEASPLSGGEVEVVGDDTDIECGTYKTVTAEIDDCYNFVNWTDEGVGVSGNNPYTFQLKKPTTLVANFQIKTFDIKLAATPSFGGDVQGDGEDFDCGTSKTVTAIPDDCYDFISWTESGIVVSDELSYTFDIIEERNLVANFEIFVYDITVSLSDPAAGILTYSLNSGPYLPLN
ncbi:MAG: choice-of-anchor L domain-containing protein, partial [Bacteroidales bacterium]|nr:choice-of-anchor L domain-containing protein [Bacteroidales bacterium]